jgi:Ni,Fe-hydrogenase III component G
VAVTESSLKEAFPESQVTTGSNGRLYVALIPEQLIAAVGVLRERFSMVQLAVIVPEDVRDAFLMNYIFTGGPVVVLQARVNREKPEVPTLAQIIPGSLVYEREAYDLFGIIPVGHPDLRRQAVPEDWPKDLFPLRKDVQFNREGEVIEKEGT